MFKARLIVFLLMVVGFSLVYGVAFGLVKLLPMGKIEQWFDVTLPYIFGLVLIGLVSYILWRFANWLFIEPYRDHKARKAVER